MIPSSTHEWVELLQLGQFIVQVVHVDGIFALGQRILFYISVKFIILIAALLDYLTKEKVVLMLGECIKANESLLDGRVRMIVKGLGWRNLGKGKMSAVYWWDTQIGLVYGWETLFCAGLVLWIRESIQLIFTEPGRSIVKALFLSEMLTSKFIYVFHLEDEVISERIQVFKFLNDFLDFGFVKRLTPSHCLLACLMRE